MEGTVGTFGGDIFSEHLARPFLSFRPPRMIRELPEYTVSGGKTEVKISPARQPEVIGQLKGLRRAHAANSAKGMASRRGFRLTSDWTQVTTTTPYALGPEDIQSQTVSFEIYFRLPFMQQQISPEWDNIDGEIEVSHIQWWME
jgi:hypothetical protein